MDSLQNDAAKAAFTPLRVEVQNLACVRGGRPVFAGLSFSLGSGELLAVTGPNGSGKSSLLRLLAGLLRLQAGSIHFQGRGEDDAVTHFFCHTDALKPALTLRETLRFSAALYGGDAADANLDGAAGMVGLRHALDLPVGVFSAGQRRRAGLARLILSPRPLWLLDEPGAALDSDGEALLGEMLSDHLARGGLVIAATHHALPLPAHHTLDMAAA